MESLCIEHTGFREEASMLLALGAQHITEAQLVRTSGTKDGYPWTEVSHRDINGRYTVITHGTRYMADKNVQFQKLLSFFPYMNQSPAWDPYELHRQAEEVADILPNPEKALAAPQPMMPQLGTEEPGRPGGMASAQDIRQPAEAVANRQTVAAGTGAGIEASL